MIAACVATTVFTSTMVVAKTIEGARLAMLSAPADLLICDSAAPDGDVLDALCTWIGVCVRRVFIVTTQITPLILERLARMQILGAFDAAAEDGVAFNSALNSILVGQPYWSSTILDILVRECLSPHAKLRRLTAAERRVLSIIGAGKSDKAAAEDLSLHPSTIATIRRSLHRKLEVHDKESLWRAAAQLGFVRPAVCTPAPRGCGRDCNSHDH